MRLYNISRSVTQGLGGDDCFLFVRLSVCPSCDVQVCFSHRLEYLENNFTAEQLKVPGQIDAKNPNIGDLDPPK